jgi:hypothetical protein
MPRNRAPSCHLVIRRTLGVQTTAIRSGLRSFHAQPTAPAASRSGASLPNVRVATI